MFSTTVHRLNMILIIFVICFSYDINVLCDESLSNHDLPLSNDLSEEFPTSIVQKYGDSNLGTFPDKPLQIIRPDNTHKNLVIVEENVKFLSSVNEPVSVISVVGKFHSGKSFLMNQLMSKSKGFGIGSRVTPETMGIWMWGKPIKLDNSVDNNNYTLLLDTEGFAATNISEIYDAKIFAVSTLMSSLLLYNSVKIIDQSDVDYLELLARRTQLFALGAMMKPHANMINESNSEILQFPALIWVIQDFVQENEGLCKDWLLRLFQTHVREDDTYPISLQDIFPSIDCQTLFIPCAKKQLLKDLSLANDSDLLQEYLIDRNNLLEKIKKMIKPKHRDSRPLTGKELVWLLRMLTNAANTGSMAQMPNRWDAFLDKLKESSINECFKFYVNRLNFLLEDQEKGEAVNPMKLVRWHIDSQRKTMTLLEHLLQGLEIYWDRSSTELIDRIQFYFSKTVIINSKKIKIKISSSKNCIEKQIASEFSKLNFPIKSEDIMAKSDELKNSSEQQLKEDLKDLADADELVDTLNSLEQTINLNADSAKLKNSQHLSVHFDVIMQQIIQDSISVLTTDLIRPKVKKELDSFLNELNNKIVEKFAKKAEPFTNEPQYDASLNKLRVIIDHELKEIVGQTEIVVEKFLKQEVDFCAEGLSSQLSSETLHFPIDMDELKAVIEQKLLWIATTCLQPLEAYSDYQCFSKVVKKSHQKINSIVKQALNKNVEAFKKEVEHPLSLAKTTILLASKSYTTYYWYRQFIQDVCLIQLNQGNAKDWSQDLKMKIIDSFMKEDDEIQSSLDSKRGLWSSLLCLFHLIPGFIQFICNIFHLIFSFLHLLLSFFRWIASYFF